MFSYVYRKPYQIHTLKQTFEKHVNTLLTACKNNSHYALIIDFNRFIAKKTKSHGKNNWLLVIMIQ